MKNLLTYFLVTIGLGLIIYSYGSIVVYSLTSIKLIDLNLLAVCSTLGLVSSYIGVKRLNRIY
jgi:hypothetical protein